MTPKSVVFTKPKRPLQSLESFLDHRVLPYPVKFLTNRVIILATLALLVPLLFFTDDQAVVNALNSYLNVMSVVVSSTVLLYATIADVRDRAAAQRREEIAKDYQQVLEKRVEEEHVLNEKILELAAQINIQGMQVERLEKVRSIDRKQAHGLARAYEGVLEKRVQAQELVLEKRVQAQEQVLEKRVQAEHELNEKILEHAVQNSIQNILVENLEKIRAEDREHAAELARAYAEVLEKRVQAQEQVLEKRVQAEHELNEKFLQSTIENVLGEHLKVIRAEEDTNARQMHNEMVTSLQTYRTEMAVLTQLIQTITPGKSG